MIVHVVAETDLPAIRSCFIHALELLANGSHVDGVCNQRHVVLILVKRQLPSVNVTETVEVAEYVQPYNKTVLAFTLASDVVDTPHQVVLELWMSVVVTLGKRHVVAVTDVVLRTRRCAGVAFFQCQGIHGHVLPLLY